MPDVQPPHPSEAPSFPTSSLTTHFGRVCVCLCVCDSLHQHSCFIWLFWSRVEVDPAHPDLHCQGVRRFVFARSHDLQSYPGCCRRKKGLPTEVQQTASCAAQIQFDSIFLKVDQRKDFLNPRALSCDRRSCAEVGKVQSLLNPEERPPRTLVMFCDLDVH